MNPGEETGPVNLIYLTEKFKNIMIYTYITLLHKCEIIFTGEADYSSFKVRNQTT